jgi:hypothetical protein
MVGSPRGYSTFGLLAVAVAVLFLTPASSEAGKLGFRNDTNGPIVVQGLSVDAAGRIRLGKVHRLQPGDVCWDLIVVPGNKMILIADGKQPTNMLYQNTITIGAKDQFYSIQAVPPPANPPKGKKPPPPAVDIIQTVVPPMATLPAAGTRRPR